MPSHARGKPKSESSVVRRSFALPARLIEQVSEAAPPEYGDNLNAVVRRALEDFVERRKRDAFRRQMEKMAADPHVRAVDAELNEAFKHTLADGLPDDPTW